MKDLQEKVLRHIAWLGSMGNRLHPNDVETAQYWSTVGHLLPDVLKVLRLFIGEYANDGIKFFDSDVKGDDTLESTIVTEMESVVKRLEELIG